MMLASLLVIQLNRPSISYHESLTRTIRVALTALVFDDAAAAPNTITIILTSTLPVSSFEVKSEVKGESRPSSSINGVKLVAAAMLARDLDKKSKDKALAAIEAAKPTYDANLEPDLTSKEKRIARLQLIANLVKIWRKVKKRTRKQYILNCLPCIREYRRVNWLVWI